MITLPIKLRKNGCNYKQVLRNGKGAIYQQMVDEKTAYFEIFLIRVRPERIIKGKLIPSAEVWPNNESFGKSSWTYPTMQQAIIKFLSLVG